MTSLGLVSSQLGFPRRALFFHGVGLQSENDLLSCNIPYELQLVWRKLQSQLDDDFPVSPIQSLRCLRLQPRTCCSDRQQEQWRLHSLGGSWGAAWQTTHRELYLFKNPMISGQSIIHHSGYCVKTHHAALVLVSFSFTASFLHDLHHLCLNPFSSSVSFLPRGP